MSDRPKSLIINGPFDVPTRHWAETSGRLVEREGRRPAGYEVHDTRSNTKRVLELELVNRIRTRVDAWRSASYPGVTSVTRRLLEHWHDRTARQNPFYFCQLEAIETLIWWIEAPSDHRQAIHLPSDGGPWPRVCSKMATGTGKTIVMGMIVAWQALNALTYPQRRSEFSSNVLVIAPGITVKDRLAELDPADEVSVYEKFSLCPSEALRQRLNHARVQIENWHRLMPLQEQSRSVVKKGAESARAFAKRVLGKLGDARDIVVLNDEAHHAYRMPRTLTSGSARSAAPRTWARIRRRRPAGSKGSTASTRSAGSGVVSI